MSAVPGDAGEAREHDAMTVALASLQRLASPEAFLVSRMATKEETARMQYAADAWMKVATLNSAALSGEPALPGGDDVARDVQFWLAELDQYGNPKLVDGAHARREGVEQAAYLMASLGLQRGAKFACAEVILTPVEPKPHGANEDAISTLNSIGLRP